MKKSLNHIQYADNDDDVFTSTKTKFEYPKICPLCNVAIKAESKYTLINGSIHDTGGTRPKASALFFCTNCERCFIGEYQIIDYQNSELLGFMPQNSILKKEFSNNIQEISSSFCTIYNQAYEAQQRGLNEICGIGYRKALEYLVKDYAISIFPDQEETIGKQPLMQTINQFIDDEKIKSLAKASAWLGNDETHYIKKHPDYDIDKMLGFMNTMVAFIDYEINVIKSNTLLNS